jgi:hypothetical protein
MLVENRHSQTEKAMSSTENELENLVAAPYHYDRVWLMPLKL